MLQKILVILVGLVMSLIGALTPSATFAAKDAHTDLADAAGTIDETLATVKGADGTAFAKIPVLWIEVDGRRVTDDAWGTGEVKELKARVGVKDIEGHSLAVGDKLVPIHPTDVITIRMFHGDFAYRDVGAAAQTLQLQGTVKTTSVHAGDSTGKLTTATGALADASSQKFLGSPDPTRVAFVVLGTGESVNTVQLQSGGERLVTESPVSSTGSTTENSVPDLGNLLVKWVKLDSKPVREYTWGNGVVSSIEFEPTNETGAALLKFRDGAADAPVGSHVLVKDFVGEYMIYQVTGGLLRLRLDGYASNVASGAGAIAGLATSAPGAAGIPHGAFEFGPTTATTAQSISFTDRSTDDGIVVFWRWNFGDGTTSVLQNPTHRYAKPGVYNVTLDITDEQLNPATVLQQVTISDAPPLVAFESLPNLVTVDTVVAFTDRSTDTDGLVTNWTWDFGDGALSYARHPNHRYDSSGVKNVTLSVRDDLGTVASLVKNVVVRNDPPHASFMATPGSGTARIPYTFTSTSTDKDGQLVDLAWNFGDDPKNPKLAQAHGESVVHHFAGPGVYHVTLVARDNVGDIDTAGLAIIISDQPPVANFTFATDYSYSGSVILFSSTAYDPDPNGFILTEEWDFGDGTDLIIDDALNTNANDLSHANVQRAADDVQQDLRLYYNNSSNVAPPVFVYHDVPHNYTAPGNYTVRLHVRDNLLAETNTSQVVHIKNRPPVARITLSNGNSTFRNVPKGISGTLSTDDVQITSVHWEFGDGQILNGFFNAPHTYTTLGVYRVNLTVGDSEPLFNTTSVDINVVNAPPVPQITGDPVVGFFPSATQSFTLTGSFTDPDSSPGTPQYFWHWDDGSPDEFTPSVTHSFPSMSVLPHQVTLAVIDGEGMHSVNNATASITVGPAHPHPGFNVPVPAAIEGTPATFTDTSTPGNTSGGYITAREWTWGDGHQTGGQSESNPANKNLSVAGHTFDCQHLATPAPWTQIVKLRVTDNENPTFDTSIPVATHAVIVDCKPIARFAVTSNLPATINEPVTISDTSEDVDPIVGQTINRTIDWGDGSPVIVTAANGTLSHAYSTSGQKTITLTARDDYGAQSVATRNITVNNRPPVARFSWDRPAIAGTGTQFHDASTDPDSPDPGHHANVVGWAWDFGDGTTSTIQNPNHTFAASGLYRVALQVTDGDLNSNPYDAASIQFVRVGGSSPVNLTISGLTPYGGIANLNDPHVDIKLQLRGSNSAGLDLTKTDFHVDVGVGGHFTLAANTWMGSSPWANADRVDISITDSDIPGWIQHVYFDMNDTMISGVPPAQFQLPLPYVPRVAADASPTNEMTSQWQDPIYSDLSVSGAHFKGSGHVSYSDGFHADTVDYGLWIRTIPLYLNSNAGHPGGGEALRNTTLLNDPTGSVIGWCKVATGTTDANGDLRWDIPRNLITCGSTELPVGHYEVQLRVSSVLGTPANGAPAEIYVDPTHGLLANLYLP